MAENPAAQLVFLIRLSKPSTKAVTVDYATRDVSATQAVDYSAVTGTLRFNPNEVEKEVRVTVHDDSHDEGEETMELVLSNAVGAHIRDAVGVGTIANSDPMPKEWLGRFGLSVADQALEGIAGRVERSHHDERSHQDGFQGIFAGISIGNRSTEPKLGCRIDDSYSVKNASDDQVLETRLSVNKSDDDTIRTEQIGINDQDDCIDRAANFNINTGLENRRYTGPPLNSNVSSRYGYPASRFVDPMHVDIETNGLLDSQLVNYSYQHKSFMPYGNSMHAGLKFLLRESHLSYMGDRDSAGGTIEIWGLGTHSWFSGADDGLSLEGDVTTALIGADYAREDWLFGVAITQSFGYGGYRNTGIAPELAVLDGSLETTLTAAIPYASWRGWDSVNAWVALGSGIGAMVLNPQTGESISTSIDWSMSAIGIRNSLLDSKKDTSLTLLTDSLWTEVGSDGASNLLGTHSVLRRFRLGLEGSHRFNFSSGGKLIPTLEISAQHETSDTETGLGLVIGSGLSWSLPNLGLEMDIKGREMLLHENDAVQQRGISAALSLDPQLRSELGFSFVLRQEIGHLSSSGFNQLATDSSLLGRSQDLNADQWIVEMGYGLSVFHSKFVGTPKFGYGMSHGIREINLSWLLTPGAEYNVPQFSDFELALKTSQRVGTFTPTNHHFGIEFSTSW